MTIKETGDDFRLRRTRYRLFTSSWAQQLSQAEKEKENNHPKSTHTHTHLTWTQMISLQPQCSWEKKREMCVCVCVSPSQKNPSVDEKKQFPFRNTHNQNKRKERKNGVERTQNVTKVGTKRKTVVIEEKENKEVQGQSPVSVIPIWSCFFSSSSLIIVRLWSEKWWKKWSHHCKHWPIIDFDSQSGWWSEIEHTQKKRKSLCSPSLPSFLTDLHYYWPLEFEWFNDYKSKTLRSNEIRMD